jgi:hypothetical protein
MGLQSSSCPRLWIFVNVFENTDVDCTIFQLKTHEEQPLLDPGHRRACWNQILGSRGSTPSFFHEWMLGIICSLLIFAC